MTNTLGIMLEILNNYPWTRLSVRIIGVIKWQFFHMATHVFGNSNLSQEIFAIDTWGAVICSLRHGRKHMLTILPTIWRPGFRYSTVIVKQPFACKIINVPSFSILKIASLKETVVEIRFDPLAPVKTTALLLPVEYKMPDFISCDEYLEPICKNLISTFIKQSETMILDNFDHFLFDNREK